MTRGIFWASVAAIAYTYVVFPAILAARSRLRPRPYILAPIEPSVTILIAAHNEVASIGAKLENILDLDYPNEMLHVVIASDGSDDGTDAKVAAYSDRGIQLLSLQRRGKAAALNDAAAVAAGEVLVFSDANSLFARDALRALVAPFADPRVGGVAGDQRYRRSGKDSADHGAGERGYWSLDRRLKVAESAAGNVISATGAIYAMRRSLFRGVPAGVTDDFANSTSVIAQGYRLVFAPDAVAWEPVAASGRLEFGRKVRIITRGLHAVAERRELLDPRRHGFYALQLLSHKVLRRLMVAPLLLVGTTAPLLWRRGWSYRVICIAQAAFYLSGSIGLLASETRLGRHRAFALPAFFMSVNTASLAAVLNVLRGRRIERWDPQRAGNAGTGGQVATTRQEKSLPRRC